MSFLRGKLSQRYAIFTISQIMSKIPEKRIFKTLVFNKCMTFNIFKFGTRAWRTVWVQNEATHMIFHVKILYNWTYLELSCKSLFSITKMFRNCSRVMFSPWLELFGNLMIFDMNTFGMNPFSFCKSFKQCAKANLG